MNKFVLEVKRVCTHCQHEVVNQHPILPTGVYVQFPLNGRFIVCSECQQRTLRLQIDVRELNEEESNTPSFL